MAQIYRKLIAVTASLTVILGFLVFHSITVYPQTSLNAPGLRHPDSARSGNATGHGKLRGNPADKDLRIRVGCHAIKRANKYRRKFPFVRMVGEICHPQGIGHKKPEKISVINTSNGYSATVFDLKGLKYVTDLIRLSRGENKIKIVQQFADDEKVVEVSIISR